MKTDEGEEDATEWNMSLSAMGIFGRFGQNGNR
jgi:hypothetical protein